VEEIVKGIELADERTNRRLAYFTTWLVAPHVKKGKVSMDKILKPLLPKEKAKVDKTDKDFLEGLLKNG